MSEHVSQQVISKVTDITYGTSVVTTGLGMLTFLNENAQAIGAICAICGVLIAAITAGLNWYYRSVDRRSKRR